MTISKARTFFFFFCFPVDVELSCLNALLASDHGLALLAADELPDGDGNAKLNSDADGAADAPVARGPDPFVAGLDAGLRLVLAVFRAGILFNRL